LLSPFTRKKREKRELDCLKENIRDETDKERKRERG